MVLAELFNRHKGGTTMTTRLRLVVGCALTVIALGSTAASAGAFSWWIETEGGKEEVLKAGIKEAFSKAMTGSPTLILAWSGNEVKCTTGSYEGGFIEGTVGLGAKAFVYEGCSVSKPAGCTVEGGTIRTKELTGSIKQAGTAVEFVASPVSGTVFAEFKVEGSECSLKGLLKATGSIGGTLTKPKELTKEKTFEVESAHSSLNIGGVSTSPSGHDGYSATKGWSAH
jgi:hypothetical protein